MFPAILLVILFDQCSADHYKGSVYDLFYTDLSRLETSDALYVCARRFNLTHQFGCSRSGGRGRLMPLAEITESTKDDVIAVVNFTDFPNALKSKKLTSLKLNGLLLLNAPNSTIESNNSYSDDVQCPSGHCPHNADFGVWNEPGKGLAFETIDFPIFGFKSAEVYNEVHECMNRFADRCQCQLYRRMAAVGNSEICYRRSRMETFTGLSSLLPNSGFCEPIGYKNILITPLDNKNATLIVAPMDSLSLFSQFASGAIDPGSSLIAIAVVADALRRAGVRNVGFAVFSGESFENSGSLRFARDLWMSNNPLAKISTIIEIGEMSGERLYMRFERENQNVTNILKNIGVENGQGGLPACAIRSFLKHFPDLTHVHLSSHQKTFENPFYHSLFDFWLNTSEAYFDNLDKLATSIFALVSPDNQSTKLTIDRGLALNISECLLKTMNCTLLQSLSSSILNNTVQFPDRNFNFHFTADSESSSAEVAAIATLLVHTTNASHHGGGIFSKSSDPLKSSLHVLDAISPAFDNQTLRSEYPMWSESTQVLNKLDGYAARLYVSQTHSNNLGCLLTGLSVLLISAIGCQTVKYFWMRPRSWSDEVPINDEDDVERS